MNNAIVGDKINVADNYAELMTIIFVTSFYFTGLPILLPIVFFSFFTKYFIEKFLICNFYSKIYLDSKINTSMFSYFKYAVFIHLGNGFWIFSN
jgi:hypothetical protein